MYSVIAAIAVNASSFVDGVVVGVTISVSPLRFVLKPINEFMGILVLLESSGPT